MKKLIVIFLFVTSTSYAQYQTVAAFPSIPNAFIPVELVNSGDFTNRLFLLPRSGVVTVFKNNPATASGQTFIDISSLLTGASAEAMGLAFHPSYENNRLFYMSYFYESGGNFIWKISRFEASVNNPNIALLNSRVDIFTFNQPASDHNGGKIIFGKDGYLYASIGDGGVGGIFSEDKTKLTGKLIRIDVDNPAGGLQYSIPNTNPYYLNSLGYRQEIYASGLRNPWKFDIDKITNRILLADVGKEQWEEIDLIEPGNDYGWNRMEGAHCFPDPLVCDTVGRNLSPPIWEYSHNGQPNSKNIIGGFFYRGHLRDELYGKFIYADYRDGNLYSLQYNNNGSVVNTLLYNTGRNITTFGIGEDNELYFGDYPGALFSFYPHFQWGDVNQDGVVNLNDLLQIHSNAVEFFQGENLDTDLDFNGVVNLIDLLIAYNEQLQFN